MNRLYLALSLALLTVTIAGCVDSGAPPSDCWKNATPPPVPEAGSATPINFDANPETRYADAGFDGTNWPDLSGKTVTILDHGAFDWAFDAAKPLFEARTGAKVNHVAADDAGTALQVAIQDQKAGGGSFDILYGVDNVLMSQAEAANIFDPYTPVQASKVEEAYRFVPTEDGAWLATPVDHGYIAINTDARSAPPISSLDDLVTHADEFVTQDPRFSSPGLGFLVATVATYGEDCYLGYWDALLDNGALITSGWTEAYELHFSGGYGQWSEGHLGDRSIVTSYTTSPAYEMYYEYTEENGVLLAPRSTVQQIQTMGILKGADRIAAEAWIEFALSDEFQALASEYNAIYPVVDTPAAGASVQSVYAGNDPTPGTFQPAPVPADYLGARVQTWVNDWVDLVESRA